MFEANEIFCGSTGTPRTDINKANSIGYLMILMLYPFTLSLPKGGLPVFHQPVDIKIGRFSK